MLWPDLRFAVMFLSASSGCVMWLESTYCSWLSVCVEWRSTSFLLKRRVISHNLIGDCNCTISLDSRPLFIRRSLRSSLSSRTTIQVGAQGLRLFSLQRVAPHADPRCWDFLLLTQRKIWQLVCPCACLWVFMCPVETETERRRQSAIQRLSVLEISTLVCVHGKFPAC